MKTGYYLELLTPETVKLLRSTENKTTKDKNGENVSHLEIIEVVLVHGNIVPNKPFRSLLEVSPTNCFFLKTFDSEFPYIEVSFTDQNNQPLEIEDIIILNLVIK